MCTPHSVDHTYKNEIAEIKCYKVQFGPLTYISIINHITLVDKQENQFVLWSSATFLWLTPQASTNLMITNETQPSMLDSVGKLCLQELKEHTEINSI